MDVKRFLLAGSFQSLLTYTFYILASKSEHRQIMMHGTHEFLCAVLHSTFHKLQVMAH